MMQRVNAFIENLKRGRINIRSLSEEELIDYQPILWFSIDMQGTEAEIKQRQMYHQLVEQELKRREEEGKDRREERMAKLQGKTYERRSLDR